MEWNIFFTIIGSAFAVIGFVYGFLRNFKADINSHLDRLEKRMDTFESRSNLLEDRMFWMATGKKLEDAILEERLKKSKTNP